MGFFSRKTKRYGGITNSRMYKDTEYPRAIKDSSASYIKDSLTMTNPSATSMADYNALGIEQSIVPSFKRAVKYASSDKFKTARGLSNRQMLVPDTDKLGRAIIAEMNIEFPNNLIIDYMMLEDVDFAHLTRQFLIDDYQYSPISNGLVIAGQDYWLADAVLYLNERENHEPVGNSFTSTYVPGRVFDANRPYTPWVYREDIANVTGTEWGTGETYTYHSAEYYAFKEQAVLSLIEKYTHQFYEEYDTVVTYTQTTDPATGVVTTTEETTTTTPIITDIYNNLPIDVVLHEFQATLEEETNEVITDTAEEHRVRTVRKYDSSYYPDVLVQGTYTVPFSDYFVGEPNIPEMGDLQEVDSTVETAAYIENFELNVTAGTDKGDIFSSSYIISIGFSYINSRGDKVVRYRTLVDTRKSGSSLGAIIQRYDTIIWDNVEITDEGFLMPDIYLRYVNNNIEKDSTNTDLLAAYPYYKRYASKLGIKYRNFLEDIYDDMKEDSENKSQFDKDWKKIRNATITFGIDVDTTDNFLHKYIFEFFDTHTTGAQATTSLVKKDIWGNNTFSWRDVKRYTIAHVLYDPLTDIFEADTYYLKENFTKPIDITGTGFIARAFATMLDSESIRVLKQISPTHCEVIEIIGYARTIKITDKKYVNGNSKEAENAAHLIPLNPAILFRCYRSFKDKESAIYKSMYIEFISYVEVKQKWYQTGLFKVLTILAGAAIGFFFPPAGIAAMSLSTAAMIGVSTLISLAINVGISIAIKTIVKAFGLEGSKWFAIVATIAAIAFGAYNAIGNIGSLFKTFTLFFNKITTYMIQAAQGLLNEVNMGIGVEMEEEAKANKEKLKALQTQADNMFGYIIDDTRDFSGGTRNYISPLIKLGKSIDQIMAEATNYNRMADTIDYVHSYPAYLLALPTLEETIQTSYQSETK